MEVGPALVAARAGAGSAVVTRPSAIARLVTVALFFGGAALALSFVQSVAGVPAVFVVAALPTTAAAITEFLPGPTRVRRLLRGASGVVLVGFYLFAIYLAGSLGYLLGWTVSPAVLALAIVLAAVGLAVPGRVTRGVRVPPIAALGVWIGACLWGWLREEANVRCDDVEAVRSNPALAIVVASAPELAACRGHETLPIGRFPRAVWESPDGRRLLFTTQAANASTRPASSPLTGSVCEVASGGEAKPTCVGEGRAQGILRSERHQRVYVTAWGRFTPGVQGFVYALPLAGPLAIERSTPMAKSVGDLFYEPLDDLLYCVADEGFELLPVRAGDLAPEPPIPVPIFPPGALRYDPERHEGILCSPGGPVTSLEGKPFMAVAVRGHPLSLRGIGTTRPLAWATMSWGCDFDPESRRAYVAVSNLGLLATIDYDGGEVLETTFVGFGVRFVVADPRRRTLYLTNFLRGDVLAFDLASRRVERSWHVGRFARMLTLSRDGRSLYVGSNVGLVRIALEP